MASDDGWGAATVEDTGVDSMTLDNLLYAAAWVVVLISIMALFVALERMAGRK